ncbi:MAG: DUF1428 family protein [Rhodospirillaceae bacterium]|nr:DUF1428 family protein [Rhodospirillaceae bacterium]
MTDRLVEIRDYTVDPARFDAYREWACELAAPWLMANLDVIDFWLDDGSEAEVTGSDPHVSPNGQANVCWIIRWPNRTARDEGMRDLESNAEWRAIWARHPCADAYLQMNARFMKAAGDLV